MSEEIANQWLINSVQLRVAADNGLGELAPFTVTRVEPHGDSFDVLLAIAIPLSRVDEFSAVMEKVQNASPAGEAPKRFQRKRNRSRRA